MPVSDQHPSYQRYSPEWERTEAAAIGSPALRLKPYVFLPEAYASEDPKRYESFVNRAYYVNLTGRTEKVLGGMVFRKAASSKLPSNMEYLLEDMDGNGEHINQIAKNALTQRLRKDRFVFLTDYPSQEAGLTEAEEIAAGLRPICSTYDAESLINWRWGSVGGRKQLVLAVLQETKNISEDEFGHDCAKQFRVLRLRDGVYTQQLYDEKLQPVTDEFSPLQAGGKPFDYIPLRGVRELDVAALQPVAEVNLAYYRNTASLEDMVSIIGAPGLHINVGDTTVDEWQQNNKKELKVGNRNALITKNGGADFFQAEERPLVRTVREDKLEELAAIGASIATRAGGAETAEAARIRAGSETSQLDSMVGDLSEDLEGVLEDMARFIGADPDDVEYKLNTDFFDSVLTAGDLDAIIRGAILYGNKAAIHMVRQGRIELPAAMTDEQLLIDATNAVSYEVEQP